MPNNGAYNNQASSPAERNVGPVVLTRLPVAVTPSSWLFEDTFDAQADWEAPEPGDYTLFRWAGDSLPTGWDALYNSGDSYPSNPNLEIGPSILNGSGKALRVYREWHTDDTFGSNANIGKLLEQDHDELYVEFEIAFMDGWTGNENAASKVFRVFSSDRDLVDFWQAFPGGHQGPLFLWDWAASASLGVRNGLFFRGGPHGDNYGMSNSDIGPIGRDIVQGSAGDISMNYTSDVQGSLTGGLTPQIPDKLNGGFLPTSGPVSHEQVFGVAGTFTKMAFYVKMNSAPNVADGIFRQYIDDRLITDSEAVRWVGATSESMPGWNAFALGGNDSWTGGQWSAADQREEFYEIRRVAAANFLPEALQ